MRNNDNRNETKSMGATKSRMRIGSVAGILSAVPPELDEAMAQKVGAWWCAPHTANGGLV